MHYKSTEAAMFAWAVADGSTDVPLDRATLYPLSTGGTLLAGWQPSQGCVVLALAADRAAAEAADGYWAPTRDALYGRWFGAGDVDAARDDPLAAVLPKGSGGLVQIISDAAGGAWPPARLTATGFGPGGALARSVGVWAAGAVPSATLRVVTFGAPRLADAR